MFLATLICAAKYLNDSSPKNKHWCRYAQMFSQAEVNLMEKQLLYLLDYNLAITEDEVVECAETFLTRYTFDFAPSPESTSLPVTPRLPSGGSVVVPDVPEVPAKAAGRYYDMGNDVHVVAPGLDRSDSSSTLGSEGPLTPTSQDSTPSPTHAHIAHATLQKPIAAKTVSREPVVHVAQDQDLPLFLANAGAAAKDARDSIVKRLFGRRREESAAPMAVQVAAA